MKEPNVLQRLLRIKRKTNLSPIKYIILDAKEMQLRIFLSVSLIFVSIHLVAPDVILLALLCC